MGKENDKDLLSIKTYQVGSSKHNILVKAYGDRNKPVVAEKPNGHLVVDTYKLAEKKNLRIISWATDDDVKSIKKVKNGKRLS